MSNESADASGVYCHPLGLTGGQRHHRERGRHIHVWRGEEDVFTDELREEVVRDGLATGGEYLYLFAQDQDVAYRDERTGSFSARPISQRVRARDKGWKNEGKSHPL